MNSPTWFRAPSATGAVAVALATVFVLHGFVSTMAVGAAGSDAPVTGFSTSRAMEHVEVIATEPHPMGSPEIASVRDYLVEQTEALGMEVDLQTVSAPNAFGGAGTVDVVNVIAWIPGTDNTGFILLMAHYDTVPSTPGANDNTSAVAALLETARALQAGPPLRNDVVFLFADGEEPYPRFGSPAFASLPGVLDGLGLVVNFEANGGTGASTLVETSGPEGWLVGEWAAAAPNPTAFSFLTATSKLIGDVGTDFDVFDNAGVPGLHFAYLRGSPIYHTMGDDIDAVGRGSLQHHGENALAVARHFGELDLSYVRGGGESVFFTIRPVLVRYPVWFGIVVAVAALLLFGTTLVRSNRAGVLRAAGGAALGGLAGAVAGTLVWMGLAAARSSPGLFEMYFYLAVLLGTGITVARLVERRVGGSAPVVTRYGRVAVWVALALPTALLLPGFGYLFGWGALAAAIGLLWQARTPVGAMGRFCAIAVPAFVLTTPAVDYLFHFASPRPGNPDSEMHYAVLVPLLLAMAAVGLAASRWHEPDRADR